MNYFWPIVTGHTFFDIWTLPHLGFWVVVGSTAKVLKANVWITLGACLAVAFGWEIFEHFAFQKWPGLWEDPESWVNSWISDPLTCVVSVLGFWVMHKHRRRRQ